MDLKVLLFMALLCLLKTSEVESQEFLKDAFNTVKNAVVKGYHHVAHIFVKHDHLDGEDEDCDYPGEEEVEKKPEIIESEITTTYVPLIDIRFQNIKETPSDDSSSFRQRDASEDKDVPDLNTRFFISAPCGDGTRKKGSGCREIINNN